MKDLASRYEIVICRDFSIFRYFLELQADRIPLAMTFMHDLRFSGVPRKYFLRRFKSRFYSAAMQPQARCSFTYVFWNLWILNWVVAGWSVACRIVIVLRLIYMQSSWWRSVRACWSPRAVEDVHLHAAMNVQIHTQAAACDTFP